MNPRLRIVVVAPDLDIVDPDDEHAIRQAERSRSLRIGLLENGFNLVASLPADVFLTERIAQLQPDLIIVDAESDARDALEHVVMATRDERRPIVMFTNDDDTRHVKQAVAAGVSAYIVAGLSPERIRPILDVALARFEHEQALLQALANLGVGFTFSTIGKNQLQAMQMTFFFFLPSILLSGFMLPFRAMPVWARFCPSRTFCASCAAYCSKATRWRSCCPNSGRCWFFCWWQG